MTGQERDLLCAHKLSNAWKTISEAELLVSNSMWNAAVNRVYYACFYAVGALLVARQLQAKKHSGVIQMFSLHFIQSGLLDRDMGRFYSVLFDMRQSGDYADYVEFEEKDVAALLAPARNFISRHRRVP